MAGRRAWLIGSLGETMCREVVVQKIIQSRFLSSEPSQQVTQAGQKEVGGWGQEGSSLSPGFQGKRAEGAFLIPSLSPAAPSPGHFCSREALGLAQFASLELAGPGGDLCLPCSSFILRALRRSWLPQLSGGWLCWHLHGWARGLRVGRPTAVSIHSKSGWVAHVLGDASDVFAKVHSQKASLWFFQSDLHWVVIGFSEGSPAVNERWGLH